MPILYINNDGGGFADYVDVPTGTTISTFVSERLNARPSVRLPDPGQPAADASRLRPAAG